MGNQQGSFYKQIEEFPKYEINCFGEIRNISTQIRKYVYLHSTGYWYVQFKKDGKTYSRKLHRLVAEYFVAKPSGVEEDLLVVKHLDNDKANTIYTNLAWDTQYNNTQDAYRDGLIPAMQGESNGRSVLTEVFVEELCRNFEEGMTPSEAVEIFGISRQQATKIRAGYAWKHIWCKYNIQVNRRKTSNDQSEGT